MRCKHCHRTIHSGLSGSYQLDVNGTEYCASSPDDQHHPRY